MPDTPRDLTSLQALLADNVTGDISPQDVRDFLVSVLGEHAEIYVHDGAAAQAGITTTPTKLTGFAANGVSAGGCTPDHTNDRITVTNAGDYLVLGQFSFSGTANVNWILHARINGVEQPAVACERKLGAAGDVGSCSFAGLLQLTAGQYVEVYVESDAGGGASLTLRQAQLVLRRVK